jgi:hypothetical protein
LGKNEKRSAKVKSATKISKICSFAILGKNQKRWPKVKSGEQKWKALPKKQNLPKCDSGQKSKAVSKSEKRWAKLKSATE